MFFVEQLLNTKQTGNRKNHFTQTGLPHRQHHAFLIGFFHALIQIGSETWILFKQLLHIKSLHRNRIPPTVAPQLRLEPPFQQMRREHRQPMDQFPPFAGLIHSNSFTICSISASASRSCFRSIGIRIAMLKLTVSKHL